MQQHVNLGWLLAWAVMGWSSRITSSGVLQATARCHGWSSPSPFPLIPPTRSGTGASTYPSPQLPISRNTSRASLRLYRSSPFTQLPTLAVLLLGLFITTCQGLRRPGSPPAMARVYADVNQHMPRAYWDYDSVNISWGVLENYEVVRKIGAHTPIFVMFVSFTSTMTGLAGWLAGSCCSISLILGLSFATTQCARIFSHHHMTNKNQAEENTRKSSRALMLLITRNALSRS